MKDSMLLAQMRFWRQRTIASLNATPEKLADIVPEGFNNSLRWNFGHILYAQESIINKCSQRQVSLPNAYKELFAGGTKPSDWEIEPPSLDEIKNKLEEQTTDLTAFLEGRLENETTEPFNIGPRLKMTTIGEVVNFTIQHELLHNGTIIGIKRALGVTDLWG